MRVGARYLLLASSFYLKTTGRIMCLSALILRNGKYLMTPFPRKKKWRRRRRNACAVFTHGRGKLNFIVTGKCDSEGISSDAGMAIDDGNLFMIPRKSSHTSPLRPWNNPASLRSIIILRTLNITPILSRCPATRINDLFIVSYLKLILQGKFVALFVATLSFSSFHINCPESRTRKKDSVLI